MRVFLKKGVMGGFWGEKGGGFLKRDDGRVLWKRCGGRVLGKRGGGRGFKKKGVVRSFLLVGEGEGRMDLP